MRTEPLGEHAVNLDHLTREELYAVIGYLAEAMALEVASSDAEEVRLTERYIANAVEKIQNVSH